MEWSSLGMRRLRRSTVPSLCSKSAVPDWWRPLGTFSPQEAIDPLRFWAAPAILLKEARGEAGAVRPRSYTPECRL